jgi:hypothetical protein
MADRPFAPTPASDQAVVALCASGLPSTARMFVSLEKQAWGTREKLVVIDGGWRNRRQFSPQKSPHRSPSRTGRVAAVAVLFGLVCAGAAYAASVWSAYEPLNALHVRVIDGDTISIEGVPQNHSSCRLQRARDRPVTLRAGRWPWSCGHQPASASRRDERSRFHLCALRMCNRNRRDARLQFWALVRLAHVCGNYVTFKDFLRHLS